MTSMIYSALSFCDDDAVSSLRPLPMGESGNFVAASILPVDMGRATEEAFLCSGYLDRAASAYREWNSA